MNGKEFEKGFKIYLQQRENDICDLAIVIASMGIPVSTSMDIAREVYKAGWRKGRNGNEKD